MKLFEWNKSRKAKDKILMDAHKEYADLVMRLCPDDFDVKVGLSLNCKFALKGVDWGFILYQGVAYEVTDPEQLKNIIETMAESCRKSQPKER